MTYKEAARRLWWYKLSFSEGITEAEYKKDVHILCLVAAISIIPLVISFNLLLPELDTNPGVLDYWVLLFGAWVVVYIVLVLG